MENKVTLTNNRFGRWGWSMILMAFVWYYFWAATGTDGLNVYPSAFSATYGMDSNVLLGFATPAGFISVIGGVLFGQLVMKKGVRRVGSMAMILVGVLYALFGFCSTPILYLIDLTAFSFVGNAFGLICTSTLMANWFPKKKGIALGWATMGAPVCTATFVTILSILVAKSGVRTAFSVIGIVIVILGVVSIFWIKDFPEMVGVHPDNMIPSASDPGTRKAAQDMEEYKSPFTIGILMKDKDFWCITLGFGFLWMVTVGIVSQFVPRMMSVGYEQGQALTFLTIASVIGILGSYFWGFLDQKIGTKLTSVIYSASYIIALVFLILQLNMATTWIAVAFVGLGIGGLLNLMPSLVISVFGKYDFTAVNRLVSPIASCIMKLAFIVMAVALAKSGGSYTMPYIIFIFIDIVGAILILLVTNKCKGKVDLVK